MRAFDFNIEDFAMHGINPDAIPEKMRSIIGEDALKGPVYDGVSTTHRLYNEQYEKVGTRIVTESRMFIQLLTSSVIFGQALRRCIWMAD